MAVIENEISQNELTLDQAAESQSLGARAWEIYHAHRAEIETPENIGKPIIIDIDSGDYEIAEDKWGMVSSRRLQARRPGATLFELKIGYNASVSFGGELERLPE